jgi:hypothetical protein
MLREHARNYYFYHNADDDEDDEDRYIGREESDKIMSETAESVFKTLFGSRDSFLASWNVPMSKNGEFVDLCELKCKESLRKDGLMSEDNTLPNDSDSP